MTVSVDFCGEVVTLDAGREFVIGRDADLSIDDNRFLHRRFLVISESAGVWVLSNVGAQLTATISDGDGQLEAFLAPGGSLPLVFAATRVTFTAGPTTYELMVHNSNPAFEAPPMRLPVDGETTFGATPLTASQRRLLVALAEPWLRGDGRASVVLPSSGQAADRLGWTITKFNRKLDNVCSKLERLGVRGLHGEAGSLASNRRSRLVEYAIATRLVTRADLVVLDVRDDADAG